MATLNSELRDLLMNILAVLVNLLFLPVSLWNCITVGSQKKIIIPKVVAITGASAGIGEAFAYAYAKDKCSLVLLARNLERLEKVAQACKTLGASDVKVAQLDIADIESVSNFFDEAAVEYNIDLFIANAGISHVHDVPLLDQAEKVLQINMVGTIISMNSVFKAYQRRGRGGQIACVSSIFGLINPPLMLSYGASKAAVMNYASNLRALGKDHGITVNTIVPGFVQTQMTSTFHYIQDQGHAIAPDYLAQKVKTDLAHDVAFISYPVYQYFGFGIFANLPHAAKQIVSELIHKYTGDRLQKAVIEKDKPANKSQ